MRGRNRDVQNIDTQMPSILPFSNGLSSLQYDGDGIMYRMTRVS